MLSGRACSTVFVCARQVRHLVLQPGVSYSCLKGIVSSHVAAGVIDFTRFERHIAKLDPKELLPQVGGAGSTPALWSFPAGNPSAYELRWPTGCSQGFTLLPVRWLQRCQLV